MRVRSGRLVIDGVRRMRYEPTPWLYDPSDHRYARQGPYTLLIFQGGFMQRIYDWQGRPVADTVEPRRAAARENEDPLGYNGVTGNADDGPIARGPLILGDTDA